MRLPHPGLPHVGKEFKDFIFKSCTWVGFRRVLILGVFVISVLTGCMNSASTADKVQVVNKLNKNVVCLLGYNYPDLSFNFTSKQAIMAKISQLEVDANQSKEIDTLGLCKKEVWDGKIKHSMLMLFVLDKDKLSGATKLEDALIERYYFSYIQLTKNNGTITIE